MKTIEKITINAKMFGKGLAVFTTMNAAGLYLTKEIIERNYSPEIVIAPAILLAGGAVYGFLKWIEKDMKKAHKSQYEEK